MGKRSPWAGWAPWRCRMAAPCPPASCSCAWCPAPDCRWDKCCIDFLAFMEWADDTLSCIHGVGRWHTFLHSWSGLMTLSCIHGVARWHTFLHSWSGPMTHFLAFMEWPDDTLSCIHGVARWHTFLHSWSGPMTQFLAFMEWADDTNSCIHRVGRWHTFLHS